MLDATGGTISEACKRSGLPKQTFYRLLKKHDLSR